MERVTVGDGRDLAKSASERVVEIVSVSGSFWLGGGGWADGVASNVGVCCWEERLVIPDGVIVVCVGGTIESKDTVVVAGVVEVVVE